MNRNSILFNIFVVFVFLITILTGRSFRVSEVPHGATFDCATCHVSSFGGDDRNAFGLEIENNYLTAPGGAGHVVWGFELASLDSDGDGFTNGEELQDPQGEWTTSSPAPGDPTMVTNPGDAASFPNPVSVEDNRFTPLYFELHNNYPNPFNPSTNISFTLSKGTNVRLNIFNPLGQLVKSLTNDYFAPGTYNFTWNARDNNGHFVESGVYYYRVSLDNYAETKQMILLK